MARFTILSLALLLFLTMAAPAFAIPVAGDYTLSSPILNGTFTSNGSMLTAWSFTTTPTSVNFTGLPASPDDPINPVSSFNTELVFQQGTAGTFNPFILIDWNGISLNNILVAHSLTGSIVIGNGTASPATVPEPSTMILFGTGLAGFIGWRYRQSVQK